MGSLWQDPKLALVCQNTPKVACLFCLDVYSGTQILTYLHIG